MFNEQSFVYVILVLTSSEIQKLMSDLLMVSHNDLYAIVMERTNNTCIIQQVAKYNETMLTLETASQGQVWYAQNKYDQYFIIIQ